MKLTPAFTDALRQIKDLTHQIIETGLDMWEAIIEPHAMAKHQRHLDEFKIVAGAVITGAGMAQLNPFTTAGGVIPAVEAVKEFQEAGHKWRMRHPAGRTTHHAGHRL